MVMQRVEMLGYLFFVGNQLHRCRIKASRMTARPYRLRREEAMTPDAVVRLGKRRMKIWLQ